MSQFHLHPHVDESRSPDLAIRNQYMKEIRGCHYWPVSHKHLGCALRDNGKEEAKIRSWNTSGEYVFWVKVREGKDIITGEGNKQDNLPRRLL